MTSRFQDKLKEIRDAGVRRSEASHKERNLEDMARSQKTVAAFEYRERVEQTIEELVANFLGEVPGFVLSRGFFEGKYMLALRLDEPSGDLDEGAHSYSRLMFLLAPHSEDNSFEIQCRKTVRNRDVETQSHSGPMTLDGLPTHSAFIEEQFLGFARVYFGDTPQAKAISLPTS
ncbi:MAG: hypothetical protein DRQ55_07885 [Planctomycetota bacterium]|nr:MAG: hypothetical protein DRQ55_07885 [Planctomycetota bacterium]